MFVSEASAGRYVMVVSESEQLIIDELAKVFDMPVSDVVRGMFSFAIYMAETRILNQIDKD